MLSHPAIEHLAHFLFLLLLRGCKKKRFFTEGEKFRSNYKSVFELGDRFIRSEFPCSRIGKLRLLPVFLIKTASSATPAVDVAVNFLFQLIFVFSLF